MPDRNTDPRAGLYMMRLGWIALSLFGVVMAWTFFQDWPPLDTAARINCSAAFALSCACFLYLAMDGADRDGTMDRFWQMRVNYRNGLPLPAKNTPLGTLYRYGAGRVMVRVCCEHAYIAACLRILPWGAAVIAMHAIFRFGFDAMRGMKPELFDGSDPDMEAAAVLTEPAIDAALAAFLLLYAWMR